MNFYQLLQLSNGKIKEKIRDSKTTKDKYYYRFVLFSRSVLVVIFCVLFVSVMDMLFGDENSGMAVILVVMVLLLRHIHFSYCIGDSLVGLAIILLILTFFPSLSWMVPVWAAIFVHFVGLMVIILLTTQKPEMGNGGFFAFAYAYLVGNAEGIEGALLLNRFWMAVVGFVICGLILIVDHRHKDREIHFGHYLRTFSLSNMKSLWQLRLAIGVSILLTLGLIFDVPRFMWMSFACSTILAKYPVADEHKRFLERIEGVLLGCILYYILCQFLPAAYYTWIGLIGGVVLGYCVKYRNKATVICFMALYIAEPIYGVGTASVLRVADNVMGAVFALLFADFFNVFVIQKCIHRHKKGHVPAKN